MLDFCILHSHVHTLFCYGYVLVHGSNNAAAQPQLGRPQDDDGGEESAHGLVFPGSLDIESSMAEAKNCRNCICQAQCVSTWQRQVGWRVVLCGQCGCTSGAARTANGIGGTCLRDNGGV